jgi:hypothetical protein
MRLSYRSSENSGNSREAGAGAGAGAGVGAGAGARVGAGAGLFPAVGLAERNFMIFMFDFDYLQSYLNAKNRSV